MKKKLGIPFFVFSLFSITTFAQSENKKPDTIRSARQIILKNAGEKNLPQQLKEKQLKEEPVTLTSDSLNTAKANNKRARCGKHSKRKRS